jgi:hypothetical protein
MFEERGQFGNPEEGEIWPLEVLALRLVKTVTEPTSLYVTMKYEV